MDIVLILVDYTVLETSHQEAKRDENSLMGTTVSTLQKGFSSLKSRLHSLHFAASTSVLSISTAGGESSLPSIKPNPAVYIESWKRELQNADCQKGQLGQTQFRQY